MYKCKSKYHKTDVEFNPLSGTFDLIQKIDFELFHRDSICSIMVEADYTKGEVPTTQVLTDECSVLFDELEI